MKTQLYNIVLTAVITALLTMLGYLFINVSQLQSDESARKAVEFTNQDAEILKQKLTDVMTDIDIRLRLIERDIEWIKAIPKLAENNIPIPSPDDSVILAPSPDPPSAMLSEDNNTIEDTKPRYDFRQEKN